MLFDCTPAALQKISALSFDCWRTISVKKFWKLNSLLTCVTRQNEQVHFFLKKSINFLFSSLVYLFEETLLSMTAWYIARTEQYHMKKVEQRASSRPLLTSFENGYTDKIAYGLQFDNKQTNISVYIAISKQITSNETNGTKLN